MCITLAPAKLSNTIIYAGDTFLNKKYVHVLGYQNAAQNLSFGGNAMILPFPADEKMTEENIVSTAECKDVLKDMAALFADDGLRRMSKGVSAKSFSDSVQVFDSDIYTVVLAEDPRDIYDALYRVPMSKRPNINKKFLDSYYEMYPGWQVALCCFSNKDKSEASPLLWWYEPTDKDWLFMPTVDSHDGSIPDFKRKPMMDHTLIAGSTKDGRKARHDEDIPYDVRRLLSDYIVGTKYDKSHGNGNMKRFNGDFWCPVEQTHKFVAEKRLPPGVQL